MLPSTNLFKIIKDTVERINKQVGCQGFCLIGRTTMHPNKS